MKQLNFVPKMRVITHAIAVLLIIHLISSVLFAETGIIKGMVTDAGTGLILAQANLTIEATHLGTITNELGEYRLNNVPAGEHTIRASFIGYQSAIKKIMVIARDTVMVNFQLLPSILKTVNITITSMRYARPLEDISLPVSVVSRQTLFETAPITIAQAMATEPGISLGRDGPWATRVTVRGLSRKNLITLVDGYRLDTATDLAAGLSLVDLNDIERVEIIRGGGSSLYGTGAIGGVINFITRDGHYASRFYVNGACQSGYSTVNNLGMGHVSMDLGSKWWYLHLNGSTRKADNTRTPAGNIQNSQFSDYNTSIKLGLQFNEKNKFRLNYQKFRAADVGIPGGAPLFPSNASVRYPEEERELFSVEYTGSRWTAFLPKVSVKYFQQNILRHVENIPFIRKEIPATNTSPARNVTILAVTPSATHQINGVQLQTEWLSGANHYLVAGVDFWKKALDSYRKNSQRIDILDAEKRIIQTINKLIVEQPLPVSTYNSMGLFVHDDISLVRKKLYLTLGGRYDWIQVANEKTLNPVYEVTNGIRNEAPVNQVILWQTMKEDNRSWSGHLGALYHLNNLCSFTFTAARSFRAPYLEECYQFIDLGSIVKIGDPGLEPEQSSFFDIGLKISSANGSIQFNGFINQLENLVVEQPGTFEGRPALINTNVGTARLGGFDGRVDLQLWRALGLYGNFAYVKGEDTKNGLPLPAIPPLNGRIGLRWRWWRLARIDASATIYGQQKRIAENEIATGGYCYFDLFVMSNTVRVGMTENNVVLGVENLANRLYRNHLATNRGLVTAEPGRNVIIRWRMEF